MLSFATIILWMLIQFPIYHSRHHHQHHNKTLTETKIVVACVGDSITAGSGSTDRRATSYPPQLENYLSKNANSNTVYETINFGVGGMTMMKDGDMPYWSTQEFAEALKSQPSIVIMAFGTNDAKKQNWNKTKFIADYVEMINEFKKLDRPPMIYICKPPPMYRAVYEIQPEIVNTKLPAIIPLIANMTSTTVIDIFQWLGGSKLTKPHLFLNESKPLRWPNDGCHPNDAGYKAIARVIAKNILGPNFTQGKGNDKDD